MAVRRDLVSDPAITSALLLARRGQAYYSRKLNELTDADFDEPSLLAGWNRRQLVAHVGLNARALARLVEWAATGIKSPMYSSPAERDEGIELSATLPVQALRNLSDHAAIHLTVEWRDLPPDRWSRPVRTAQGRTVPVSETVWMRTREVWMHAVDLRNGGRIADFPPELVDALLDDVVGAWQRRRANEGLPDFVLDPTDRGTRPGSGAANGAGERGGTGARPATTAPPVVLSGTAAGLLGWATGRAAAGDVVVADGEGAPPHHAGSETIGSHGTAQRLRLHRLLDPPCAAGACRGLAARGVDRGDERTVRCSQCPGR
ncbi:MAG: mycothiol-dependent maleylpyruvate isomerase [Cryobacterium sp.]|nr:mycothiol-dependent maleylpyruvate isomerase [Cryobacterium sp.]